ncbi:MAG: porin [Rhodoferax sp.]
MKRTLIALAVMTATGAFAQSTVTISGQLDVGLAVSTSGANVQTTTLAGGQFGASRLRFVGVEDMGGGNKANFWLEMQPNLANGSTSANGLFNRSAWTGLSGGWGEMRLGRQGTTTVGVACTAALLGCYGGFGAGGVLLSGTSGAAGPNGGGQNWISGTPTRGGAGLAVSSFGGGFNSSVAPAAGTTIPGAAVGTTSSGDVVRVVNAVTYLTPDFSGFSGQVQYAFGGVAGASGDGSTIGLLGSYAKGPIWAALAYSSVTGTAASPASGTATTLAGSYDFGMAKVGLIYQKEGAASNGGPAVTFTDATAYALTLAAPIGAATVYGRFGNRTVSGGTNTLGTVAQIANIGVTYDLSKRTKLYADYVVDTSPGQSGVMAATNPSQIGLGLQHTF